MLFVWFVVIVVAAGGGTGLAGTAGDGRMYNERETVQETRAVTHVT